MRIGIIGGGLSGLTLQRFLKHDSEVLEKEGRIGGLCRTFSKDGFSYDIGGHILFSKDKDFLPFIAELLQGNVTHGKRENRILFKGHYVKYPFENDLAALDKQDAYECLIGYLKNTAVNPSNFKEWMLATFGEGITGKYLLPYNEKIWKFPIERMSMDWVERIPKPPVEDVVRSALGISTEGYVHQLYFDYPAVGGIEALPRALHREGTSVRTAFEVRSIRRQKNAWSVSDGKEEFRYDKLVLTMPLDKAIACMEDVPSSVVAAVSALRYNSIRVVMVGINNASLMDKLALYVPDPAALAHRICYMGRFSPRMVPAGCSSIMAEITAPKGHAVARMSDASLIQRVVDDGHTLGLFDRRDVVATDIQNIEYAYVVYDLHYHENVKIVRDYFSSLGIELLGRLAEFDYINMDEAIRRARARAECLNKSMES